MKKNFNYKMLFMILGFGLSVALIVLGKNNIYCMGFGFAVLGALVAFYAYEKSKTLQKNIIEVDEELSKVDSSEHMYILELNKIKKQLKKQKNVTCLMFYVCGALLIVLGMTSMF